MYPVSARFLQTVAGTHQAVVKALLCTQRQFGPSPTGTELPILAGDVKFSSTADIKSTLDITVPGDYWDDVQPYGAEIWVARGVAFGDGTSELVPLGYFHIHDAQQDDAPFGPVALACQDRNSLIMQNRVLFPYQVPDGTSHRTIFERLVNGRITPDAELNTAGYAAFLFTAIPIIWTGYDPDRVLVTGTQVVEDSTYDFLSKLADSKSCVLRFDELGQLNVELRDPDPDAAPVYAVGPGAVGNLVKATRKTTADGVYNIVSAYGSDPAAPTGYQLSYNKDRNSPLRWDGVFGPAPRYYASPLLRTPDAAADAAASILSHYTGLPATLGLFTVPNPALRPQDAVSAKITGLAEVHAIDEVTIPVTISGAGPVEITTKTTNVVVIPDPPDVPDTGSGDGTQNQPTPAQIAQEKAFQLTSTAENSTVQWWTQFSYLEDIGDGRGYTGGIFGATSATGDMLELVQAYVSTKPTNNVLAPFVTGLQACATTGQGGSASSTASSKLGTPFKTAWATAAQDPVFQTAQINYRNQVYWTPAFNAAVADGLSNLGLAIYYDTCINHGAGSPAEDDGSFDDIRAATTATPPSAAGDEATFLKAFLVKRGVVLTAWGDNPADGRIAMFNALIDTANFTLTCPFSWSVYGDSYTMSTDPIPYGFVSGGSGTGSTAFPTPALAHNIGSQPGQNSFNLGVGFDGDATYGTTHHDFTRDEIEAGLTIPGYYELNASGEVLMSAHPGGGKTSNNTSYSRVEYRELERDGTTKMAFNPSVGRHYMKGRSECDALASAKPQVVLAQMHNADDDTAMVYINNSTQVLAKVNGTSIGTLGSHTVGGPVHDWMIEIVDGTINFYWDDLTTVKLSSDAFKGVTAGQYFKAGDYMQWNLTNGDATISRVRLAALEHWHSQTPKSATPWPQPARPAGQTGTGGSGTSGGTGTAGFLAQMFVATTGSDSNNGLTKAAPKLTIGAAITAASAGNTISVASGTYSGNLVPSKGGSAGNYITVRSETPRGARISGDGSGNQAAVEINHAYLRFQDMDITGDPSSVRYGVMITADNVDIRNNHIHGICKFRTEGTSFQGGAGIDFEGSTHTNITLDGNEIHDIGPGVAVEQLVHGLYLSGDCTNVVVSNNLIYNCEDFGIQVYPTEGSSGFVHVNNTVVGNGRGIQQASDGITRNNISYNNQGSNYDIRGTGNVLSNNLSGGTGNTTGTGITAGVNPLFARYATDGTGDFHLQSTSPALNAGTALDAPSRDFAGTSRPQGTGIDLGAFETVVGTTTGTGSTGGGSTGTGSTGGTSSTDDGVEAAKLLGWGAVIDGDEFNYTGAPMSKWSMYDGPGHDNNGTRDPEAFSVANGVMTCTSTAGGSTGGMAFNREQKFCRVEWRVRTYSINPKGSGHRYHPVLIYWPTSDEWPQGGEFDFYECDNETGKYEAYLHIPGNDGSAQEYVSKACDISQWHNVAFEWSSSGIKGWLDGQQVFSFPGFKQPPGTMHATFQSDNFFGSSGMEPAKFEAVFFRIYNSPS